MPKIHVTRSILIKAPLDKVYAAVADLDQWAAWSPWLIMEPEATVIVGANKESYSWKGERVGEGYMSITEKDKNRFVGYDLTFLKPFSSKAKVGMALNPIEEGVEVSWSMDSHLKFYLFFLKKMMLTFIGMDYERGLKLLKDYVEDGQVHSQLDFVGRSEYPGCEYVGIQRQCTITDMPEAMGKDFQTLMPWAKQNGMNLLDGFCIYEKFDPMKDECHYVAAVKYTEKPANLPDGFILGSQPASLIYTLKHTGPYDHLGNAWATMYSMIRAKEIKAVKKYPPFETYGNTPMDTEPNDLITFINFAIA